MYYLDFKLILCSLYNCAIIRFNNHLKAKHLLDYSKKQKNSLIKEALIIFQTLEVNKLDESFRLINLFKLEFILLPFLKLKPYDNLFKY